MKDIRQIYEKISKYTFQMHNFEYIMHKLEKMQKKYSKLIDKYTNAMYNNARNLKI